MGRLLTAEAEIKAGDYEAANAIYLGLIDSDSGEMPLRVAAWRGALKSSSSGRNLVGLLTQLLSSESPSVQLRALPIFRQLRLMDEAVDNLLFEGLAKNDSAVGIMLVELLSSRNSVDVHSRLISEFSNSNDHVKGAIIEVCSRDSGRVSSDFLIELIFESEQWSELASDSLVTLNNPSVDEYLLRRFLDDDGVSVNNQALATDLLRNRGTVRFKSDFYRMLIGSEPSVRSAITHALRDWADAGDLETILDVMAQSDENALRNALSRLFVSLAQTEVKDEAFTLEALNKALSTADASLKATLLKMKEAIKR